MKWALARVHVVFCCVCCLISLIVFRWCIEGFELELSLVLTEFWDQILYKRLPEEMP